MKSTIQKHSRRASSPGGTASQARTQASTKPARVKPHASRIVSAPEGSGRFGLFTRSISRS